MSIEADSAYKHRPLTVFSVNCSTRVPERSKAML
jgi:hypothetical protein